MAKKTILITGGTGFLGRKLAIALKNQYTVVLGARNHKQNLKSSQVTDCDVVPMDVANINSVRDAILEVKPNIIIHAAATKFVDISEKQPLECIDINVIGSENVARVAMEQGVEIVVGISTDKASPPVRNTYGLSKALMERAFCSLSGKTNTKFTCVRYGNVAWSTGSVLPIWKKMFNDTGVIGTTGPEMRRFFFTVDEAVELVINSIDNIDTVKGKVLSRQMKSAKIEDLLNVWKTNFGGDWEKIDGRPGERIDEYLIGEIELEYTCELVINEIPHYLISFNTKQENSLSDIISSENAQRLTDKEILHLISNPPNDDFL